MALGAVTIVSKEFRKTTQSFHDVLSFAGENPYATGGMLGLEASVEAALVEGRRIIGIIPQDCAGYLPVWVPSTNKVKVYYVDNNNAADGPLIEVPNGTDLSSITFNVILITA